MTSSDQKPKETAEEFMSRWSRRKQQVREEAQNPPPVKAITPATAAEAPVLPPVEQLGMDSDYRGFFHPKVDETLRRAALKKLFSDPHFNIMDGLDIYIDDYSISDPLPAAMMNELKQAQNILAWARETEEEAAIRRALPETDGKQIAKAEADSAEAIPALESEEAVQSKSDQYKSKQLELEPQEAKTEGHASGQPTPDDGEKNT